MITHYYGRRNYLDGSPASYEPIPKSLGTTLLRGDTVPDWSGLYLVVHWRGRPGELISSTNDSDRESIRVVLDPYYRTNSPVRTRTEASPELPSHAQNQDR